MLSAPITRDVIHSSKVFTDQASWVWSRYSSLDSAVVTNMLVTKMNRPLLVLNEKNATNVPINQ